MEDTSAITQDPAPGTHSVFYRGDTLRIRLTLPRPTDGSAFVRTNLGRGARRRRDIVAMVESGSSVPARDWHDIEMAKRSDTSFEAALPLLEVGRFEAKAYFLSEGSSEPAWPTDENLVIKVEPAEYVSGNTLYTAFVRQFGAHMRQRQESSGHAEAVQTLEESGYAVIPLSGTFRNLAMELDAIIKGLRCRIIHLLPIHPIPTTYARMGRFGSPFAALDFMDVDPALAEFDRKTTPLEQFDELVDGIHSRGGRVFLDIPVNHTGWASHLQIEHPEWFVRDTGQRFMSPGAWGVTWEDLSELDYSHRDLWQYMARVFLTWCRHGVDGFRCDAGYKLPRDAWEYIVAKVRTEFPSTIFLLEGLGGKLTTMEALLDEANMDWAYSELFQNYDRTQVEEHLSYCLRTSSTRGLMVHYAETHDNDRLAATSHRYARLRTALAALCSEAGAFGITNGVEWYADEKVDVHGAPSLRWGHKDNMVGHIFRLNTILHAHSCFKAGAGLRLLDSGQDNAVALIRHSPDGAGLLLVAANLDASQPAMVTWSREDFPSPQTAWDLLSGREMPIRSDGGNHSLDLQPEEIVCISACPEDRAVVENALKDDAELSSAVEHQQALAKALDVRNFFAPDSDISDLDTGEIVSRLIADPRAYCGGTAREAAHTDGEDHPPYPPVVTWEWPGDSRRIVSVPPRHFVLITAPHAFFARLDHNGTVLSSEKSICSANGQHFVLLLPREEPAEIMRCLLRMRVFDGGQCRHDRAELLFLPAHGGEVVKKAFSGSELRARDVYALLSNERGAMSQVHGAWGMVNSQYDALLAGNPDPECPSDRRVMFTSCRAWLVFKGHYQDIDLTSLESFQVPDRRTARWRFHIPATDGKIVEMELQLRMIDDRNAVSLAFKRGKAPGTGRYMPDDEPVTLIFRPDIEDRNQHEKTKAWTGPQSSWADAVSPGPASCTFRPAPGRSLHLEASAGAYVPEPEWIYNIEHSVEAERGLEGTSDLFSPGYFTASLAGGQEVVLNAAILIGDEDFPEMPAELEPGAEPYAADLQTSLKEAMHAFIVKRNRHRTVIAGYPWFLDWGRDTLICLRGMIAAGILDDSRDIMKEFARYESEGTLPNMIRGRDVSNRDTSDAPLWFLVACSDLVRATGNAGFLSEDCGGRTILDVLRSIAENYRKGTPNGIRMDEESGLIFSPSHFTWMDTNYPAGTPRQGYPIEIQALWFAALTFLDSVEPGAERKRLIRRVQESVLRLYPVNQGRYLSDCLHARTGQTAGEAMADDALRPNQLLAITLGCVADRQMQAGILRACEQLLVPGAIRTLADQPVRLPLRIARDGTLLNDPHHPYWGHYSGVEDTHRKPAYHNGTAWAWPFPSYCEALDMTFGAAARPASLALLSGCSEVFNAGCTGQLPEIIDGDSPHTPRGCGAQAWSVTEMYRVIAMLSAKE